MKNNIFKIIHLVIVLVLLFISVTFAEQPKTHIVTVNADGSFTPGRIYIHDGDTVEWRFSERTDSIIPVDSTGPLHKISWWFIGIMRVMCA